jgi:hypothetical protein
MDAAPRVSPAPRPWFPRPGNTCWPGPQPTRTPRWRAPFTRPAPAPEASTTWLPGTQLSLRGPLGHGFNLPPAARRVALIAFGNTSARLLALLEPALAQKAALTLLTDAPLPGLPSAVEISPLTALPETLRWADYLALDLPTGPALDEYKSLLRSLHPGSGQVFIETPVPCGGLAECGVCAVNLGVGLRYACHDGPVFDLRDFIR